MAAVPVLLHSERLLRIPLAGKKVARNLALRAEELRAKVVNCQDPGITVLIRTRNNAEQLEGLFADIAAQEFNGPLQVVVVDTESTDGTPDVARRHQARVVRIAQKDFTYPLSLNLGFRAATHPFVLCLVGHSSLTNTMVLKTAACYAADPSFGGAFSWDVPDANATRAERLIIGHAMVKHIRRPARSLHAERMGLLSGNSSLVSKKAWEELGGYDERYAAGGEDADLGRRMLRHGYHVIFEPVLTVYHTHGLGWVGLWRQLREWRRLSRPLPFAADRLKKYRRDLSLP